MPMFRKRIQDAYAKLSPSYQRVGRFILDHYHEAVFMSASQLAMRLDVDAATVVRFAQKIGYSGYPNLLEDMRKVIQQDLYRARTSPAEAADMTSTTLAVIELQVNNLQAMRASLNRELLSQALEQIVNAHRIYIIGEGVSRRLADLGAYGLRVIGLDAVMVEPTIGDALAVFTAAGQEDLLLVVACTELCPLVTRVVKAMKERGMRSVGIVGALYWPVAQLVDIALVAPIASATFVTNFAATAALINAMGEGLLVRQGAWLVERARGVAILAQELMGGDELVDPNTPREMMSRLADSNHTPPPADDKPSNVDPPA